MPGRRRNYANMTHGFMLQIRTHRLHSGISRKDAAAAIGMDPGQWSHQEAGRYDTALNTVYAMADAVGLRITLRPKSKTLSPFPTKHHRNRTSFQATPVDDSAGNATPATRGILARLRGVRTARQLTQLQAAHLLQIRAQTLSDLERGKKEPSYGRIAAYADALGLALGVVPARHSSLLEMSGDELDAVRKLVTSYANHCIRMGKALPPHLLDAAEKMDSPTVTTLDKAA